MAERRERRTTHRPRQPLPRWSLPCRLWIGRNTMIWLTLLNFLCVTWNILVYRVDSALRDTSGLCNSYQHIPYARTTRQFDGGNVASKNVLQTEPISNLQKDGNRAYDESYQHQSLGSHTEWSSTKEHNNSNITIEAKNGDDCNTHLAGLSVVVLDVHMEGNLGDEMETTPLLKELHRCSIQTTVVLSDWLLEEEENSLDIDKKSSIRSNRHNMHSKQQQVPRQHRLLHDRTVREQALVHKIVSSVSVVTETNKLDSANDNDSIRKRSDFSVTSSQMIDLSTFDAILVAPGPWRLCQFHQRWPTVQVDAFFGGSIILEEGEAKSFNRYNLRTSQRDTSQASTNNNHVTECHLSEIIQWYSQSTKLFVTREPVSHRFLLQQQRHRGSADSVEPKVIMGGDLSYSFQPSRASVMYWKHYYSNLLRTPSTTTSSGTLPNTSTPPVLLLFSRANNFGQGVRIKRDSILVKIANGTKLEWKLSQVIFCTSSDIEDLAHLEWIEETYYKRFMLIEEEKEDEKGSHFDHRLSHRRPFSIVCRSVEQLFGLIQVADHIYTDRYHPGVAAHYHGVPFTVLSYPYEQTKLNGLTELTPEQRIHAVNATTSIPNSRQDIQKSNELAFSALRHLLLEKKMMKLSRGA